MKNGSLVHLSLRNAISLQSSQNFRRFFNSFKISEQDHERWYGEEKVAKEMKLEQLEAKLFCGLKYLDLKDSNIGSPSPAFRLKDYEIKTDPVWPPFIEFLGKMDLEHLNLRDCGIN